MRLVIIGNNDGPARLAAATPADAARVVAVGFQKPPPAPAVRLLPNHVRRFAAPDEATAVRELSRERFDVLINCFANFRYRRLLDRYRCLNVHPAPLPRYRGRHPLQWALINGEPTFGMTVHEMTAAYDAGPILLQTQLTVTPGWSTPELREALMEGLTERWPDFVRRLARGNLVPRPNDPARAHYVPRRYPADSRLNGDDLTDHRRAWRKVRALRAGDHPAFLPTTTGEPIRLTDAALPESLNHRPAAAADARPPLQLTPRGLSLRCTDGQTVWLTTDQALSPAVLSTILLP